jgi:radical S-adenosyl methionine domain-containing protein 2
MSPAERNESKPEPRRSPNERTSLSGVVYSVNWHVSLLCDAACLYCFEQRSDRPVPIGRHLYIPKEDAYRILDTLWNSGCRKLTFAGGEPTLCRELPDLIRHAWVLGMEVMLVTNGSGVTEEFMRQVQGCLAAIKVSVDSPSEDTLRKIGRSRGDYLERVRCVRRFATRFRVRFMLNTVVCRHNWNEDFHSLIEELQPERWKVFRVLRIRGQNDSAFDELSVTDEQFAAFQSRHRDVPRLVPEDNDAMTDSYVMIDPWGRIFQNSGGVYRYGNRILDVGVEASLRDSGGWDKAKFLDRGGLYEAPRSPASVSPVRSRRHRRRREGRRRGWRIRIDRRAEPGALFNLKQRMFDWFRNNPSGNPVGVRIGVAKEEGGLFVESTNRDESVEAAIQSALSYAKCKATKSQRLVAGARLERV